MPKIAKELNISYVLAVGNPSKENKSKKIKFEKKKNLNAVKITVLKRQISWDF